MKKYTKIIVIVTVALIVGLLLGRIMFNNNSSDANDHAAEAGENVTWTCSMHPNIRQPEFGDCPICGMDLIPLENEQNENVDPNAISMSNAAMQLADVRTAVVKTDKALKTLHVNGRIAVDERRVFSQSSHLTGRVEDLSLDFTGQKVKKGQVIAFIYAPELISAQEELFEALKLKNEQAQLLEAAKNKLRNWKISDEQINELIASGEHRDSFPVLAGKSGVVTGKYINRGDYIKQGQILYEISDLSKVWLLIDVYESDIKWIESGDHVRFTLASLPGEHFDGTIEFIDPLIDSKTRIAHARVNLDNPSLKLLPGMFASVKIDAILENYSNDPIIPASSVMWTGKRSLVYVREENENSVSFRMREVTLGPDLGDRYVIVDGLDFGEVIAVSGTFSIDAAAQLSGKTSMMNHEGETFKSTHDHDGMDMSSNTSPLKDHKITSIRSLEISNEAREALMPVYDAYLDLKDALVADKTKQAKQEILKLQKELENIDMSLFTGDAHHAFMASHEKILMHIPEKKKLKDIEGLRNAFEFISDAMIELTRTFTPQEGTLYVQYCPMAFNNKGADWISRDADIKNPYFGASMLTCGEITDTLKTK
jgi:membrane fusion protein, copper/silver efflux system